MGNIMLEIAKIRKLSPNIICLGSHPGIIQSMLDFDYLCGKPSPSVAAIIASGRRSERYFYGTSEVVIPVKSSLALLPEASKTSATHILNLSSGRRVLASTLAALETLPNLAGGAVFAERFPERQALELAQAASAQNVWLLGGASVGLVVAGQLKLGAIGGTEAVQLEQSRLMASDGQIAVLSSSGGMVNEIIRTVANTGYGVSFALALGGERFPMVAPEDAALAAEHDPSTKAIAYFGELGGDDEYRLAELLASGKITKPITAYIGGSVADLFAEPPQFGHAKAMAASRAETAAAKAEALQGAGAKVGASYSDFVKYLHQQNGLTKASASAESASAALASRRKRPFASSLSRDQDGEVYVAGHELTDFATSNSFAHMAASMFLGKSSVSKDLEDFVDLVLKMLVDHGPYVSGAVNTMVTARAGKDLVSSLASGLLTIGPRFGGAINTAASIWLEGVASGASPAQLVERYASQGRYLLGIGHRKYRADFPDPRVAKILAFSKDLKQQTYSSYAQAVAQETIQKKGNLILNVDGAIAAVLLDLLAEKEGYTPADLQDLADTEFFNALFVLSRSVGFMAHYFDQKRLDEGLFRLSPDDVADA
jgi:ATP citrate (pro-S)-lyase